MRTGRIELLADALEPSCGTAEAATRGGRTAAMRRRSPRCCARPGWAWVLNEHLEHENGEVVFRHACKIGLEGIVSKRAGSFYRCGKSRNWLKAKNPDFVRT